MSRFVFVLTVLCSSIAMAGNFQGQGRDLEGKPVANVTVTAIRSDGGVLFNNTFSSGNYSIPINNAVLFADNKAISLLFSAPGRQDARLDNLLGTTSVASLDVTLPLKYSAPLAPNTVYQRHHCRIFGRRR